MFLPINSLKRGPGVKNLHGLGVDVPAYNFPIRRGPGVKFRHGLGVDVPAYKFSQAWARRKKSSWPGGRCSRL